MASVHSIGQAENRGQLRSQEIISPAHGCFTVDFFVAAEFSGIIPYRTCDHLPLLCGKTYDFRSHDDPVRAFCHLTHTDIFSAVMKKNRDLQKKPFTFSHAVDLPCTVKNIFLEKGTQVLVGKYLISLSWKNRSGMVL